MTEEEIARANLVQERLRAVDATLVPAFNGAVKYTPMVQDHPEWTNDDCVAFAKIWTPVAVSQLRAAFDRELAGGGNWFDPPRGEKGWNTGIPYCRNIPTGAMIREALK